MQTISNIKFIIKTYGKDLGLGFSFKEIAKTQLSNIEKAIKTLMPMTKHICIMQQTHSSKTVNIEQMPNGSISIQQSDALVSRQKNIVLCAFHADCVPVVAIDQKSKITGIAHTGWRGAKNNILENMIKSMTTAGSSIQNIQINIGPCIRQECYEVDNDFFHAFLDDDKNNRKFFISIKNDTKQLFNLPEFIKNKLKNLGIVNINDTMLNTYSHENYFSYRKSSQQNKPLGSNITIVSAINK
ncbi:Purine nucleoside phosphorylase [Candidatus Xenohaliotis californiensis]|uniref:Purine nucleoside phosphorylase n=1 Tax=Candidatus Xenohaliotis californiensis TaxID=84677 RepID=A0ABP0EW71_9RICK|nr:Purine nucleoside phosphorylase [Candidatus Xenohaliotis californiensis]